MSVITETVSRILFPFLLLFSIYVITHGHLTAGGGFPGGVLIASTIILVCVVYGLRKAEHIIKEETSHRVEAIGGVLLAFIVFFEFFIRGKIFSTGPVFHLWSGGEIPILNVIGGIMVMSAFLLIFYSMVKER